MAAVESIERWTPAHQAVEMGEYETLAAFLDARG